MDPEFEPVVPDQLFRVNIGNGDREDQHYMVNAKYDRIDLFTRYGQYVLKVMDEEDGLVSLYVDEPTAFRVQDYAGLPIVPRDQITQSEYEAYLKAQATDLEDWI